MGKPRAIFQGLVQPVAPTLRWLSTHPRAVFWVTAGGLLVAAFAFLLQSMEGTRVDLFPGEYESLPILQYLRKWYFITMWMLLPAFVLCLVRYKIRRPTFAVILASAIVFVGWAGSEIVFHEAGSTLEHAGVEPSWFNSFFRIVLTGGLILSPPLLMILYSRTTILDRYLLRQFLLPFNFCFIGFIAIWLIMDLSDNGGDFIEAKALFSEVLKFYIVQLPQIIVLIMPVALLLALLYSLSKMSRSNEIISMLSSGKSLYRILRPIFFVGIYASLVTLALNYEWAPQAEGVKETVHDDITKEKNSNASVTKQMYRNREDRRTWFVGEIPFDLSGDGKISTVEIFQEDENGKLARAWYASRAKWYSNHPTSADRPDLSGKPVWRLIDAVEFDYTQGPEPIRTSYIDVSDLYIPGWRETPWKIFSESVAPEHLGVPGLGFHLKTNPDLPERKLAPIRTHLHHRWAQPWSCLVIVLIAAPLGIVYSRRGVLGGVATCIFIFFASLVLTEFFLAMGQGYRMPAFLGAWTTNFIFAVIGVLLLRIRAQNKDVPKPTLTNLKRLFKRNRRRRTRRTRGRSLEFN